MTPKEKADELLKKFLRIEDDTTFYWDPSYDERYTDEEVFNHAKKCVLFVCDEFIAWSQQEPDESYNMLAPTLDYWEKVKNEVDLTTAPPPLSQ